LNDPSEYGIGGIVRIYQGASLVDHQTLSTSAPYTQFTEITFDLPNLELGDPTYTMDMSGLYAYDNGFAAASDIRWRIPPSYTYSYSLQQTGIDSTGDSPDVEVKLAGSV